MKCERGGRLSPTRALWFLVCASVWGLASCATTSWEGNAVLFDAGWEFAENSKINSGHAVLYYAPAEMAKQITVCLNAGHGTKGGDKVKTLCHPDGSPKLVSGSTKEGATLATAVSFGTRMINGRKEATINLKAARVIRDRLLQEGYHVLMIRDSDDVQLDNIARTLMANAYADCHIAIHYDDTQTNKGAFFLSVPESASYRAMYPVSAHWEDHHRLGRALVQGLAAQGFSLYHGGELAMDLTQTSYSTVPSVDLEVGDRASRYSDKVLQKLAAGVAAGLHTFFAP